MLIIPQPTPQMSSDFMTLSSNILKVLLRPFFKKLVWNFEKLFALKLKWGHFDKAKPILKILLVFWTELVSTEKV